MNNPHASIHSSHLLNGNSGKLKDYYKRWAIRYEKDVKNEHYSGPGVMASITYMTCLSFLEKSPEQTRILDAGCGTGLVGTALVNSGFKNIDGLDLSEEMGKIAAQTKSYKNIWTDIDLSKEMSHIPPSPLDHISYDIIVCCGVFTLGHLEPTALSTLHRFVAKDGFIIVSTRKSYLEQHDFERTTEGLLQQRYFSSAICIPNARYIGEERAHYWIFQVDK
ncbi:class I SAM-dependent DNA methyltransferase [Lonsdalea quercina]|uniref:Methyltransferase domain-containing protein n=1 Tax=Lonsdalea quercina TaxID=71657 RepID=A0A1H3VKB5_9GAMM|nr:class I SAM-dependent methyltransferase [Lonsdalea quercina]SDZ75217.1 Methyltransferase domain-containing protein [Lonsdalea quercina]